MPRRSRFSSGLTAWQPCLADHSTNRMPCRSAVWFRRTPRSHAAGRSSRQGPVERLVLVRPAAPVDVVPPVGVLLAGPAEVGDRVVAGAVGPHVQVQPLPQLGHEGVRLGEQVAGVDEDDLDAGDDAGGHVQQDGRVGPEAAGHDDVVGAELGRRPLDHGRRVGRLEAGVDRGEVGAVAGGEGVGRGVDDRHGLAQFRAARRADRQASSSSSNISRGTRRPRARPRSMSFLFVPWKSLPPVLSRW